MKTKPKRKLSAAGEEELRKATSKLFANCENVTDARAARESVVLLEKLILAREATTADSPLVLKEIEGGSRKWTLAELEPYQPV